MLVAFFATTPRLSISIALGIIALFVWCERPYLRTPLLPFGDDASHDMLVERAKHLLLLHGHYSRVGFYHPGPFLLWVYAVAELAFCDVLGVATLHTSKMLGVFCLWIATLAVVERIYRDLTESLAGSLAAIAVTVAAIVAWQPNTLVNTFFPIATVSSAVLFFASGAALVAGHLRWIWAFVLAGAALVHEHASFVALVPGMIVLFLLATCARDPKLRSTCGLKRVAARHRGSLRAAGIIGGIFALPILVESVIHFPGELPKYVAFAGAPRANPWPLVGSAIAQHWRSAWPVGVLAVVVGCRDRRLLWAPIATFACGTLAAALYARRGVDDLVGFSYTLAWYQAVPAVCAGLVVTQIARRARGWLLVPALLLPLVLAHAAWPKPSLGVAADVRALSATLGYFRAKERSLGRPVRLVIDYRDGTPSRAWDLTLGILAAQARSHERLICVDAGSWMISYHAWNRCDPPVGADPVYVATMGGECAPAVPQATSFAGLRFYELDADGTHVSRPLASGRGCVGP